MDYMQALAEYERLQAEKNKANPPPTPTPTTTTGLVPWEQLYYSRNIKEVLGWTLATFLEQMKLIRTLPAGSLTAEQMYAVGMYPDMKTARRRKAYNDLVNSTGGSWDNGVLTPPPDWEGSVTDYSKWLSDQLDSMGFGPGTPTGIDTGDGTTGGDEGLTAPETIPPIPVPETFGDYDNGDGGGNFWQDFWDTGGDNDMTNGFGPGDTTTIPGTPPWSDYDVGSPKWFEYQYKNPYMGYMSQLGLLGKEYLTPYQQYMASDYPWLEQLYNLQSSLSSLHPNLGYQAPSEYLGAWAQPYAQNPFAMYNQAKQMLGSVLGMTPEQRAEFGYSTGTSEGMENLANLLGMGTRDVLGLQGSGWLSSRLPVEHEKWIAKYPQQQGPTFMDYIVQKYNLGQYF